MALKPHQRLRQRAFLAYSRLTRGMTFGVRAMLLQGRARHAGAAQLRVRAGIFPGGGVEVGESVREALVREIARGGRRGPYRARRAFRALPQCPRRRARPRGALRLPLVGAAGQRSTFPNHEIVACELFPLDALPADTSPGTRGAPPRSARRRASCRRLVGSHQRCGMPVPRKRSRSCGASMISSGPSGTMRVGLMRSWL